MGNADTTGKQVWLSGRYLREAHSFTVKLNKGGGSELNELPDGRAVGHITRRLANGATFTFQIKDTSPDFDFVRGLFNSQAIGFQCAERVTDPDVLAALDDGQTISTTSDNCSFQDLGEYSPAQGNEVSVTINAIDPYDEVKGAQS